MELLKRQMVGSNNLQKDVVLPDHFFGHVREKERRNFLNILKSHGTSRDIEGRIPLNILQNTLKSCDVINGVTLYERHRIDATF